MTLSALALDSIGNTVIAGCNGNWGFVTKTAAARGHISSTNFAGGALAMAVDAQGNIYVTGATLRTRRLPVYRQPSGLVDG